MSPFFYRMKKVTNLKKYKIRTLLVVAILSVSILTATALVTITISQTPEAKATTLQEVKVDKEISAPIDKVWNIVSNVDNETKYWPTFKTIKNIAVRDNTTEREVTITAGPLGDRKTHQFVTVNPEQFEVLTNVTEGPFTGTRSLTLNPSTETNGTTTIASVVWQMDLSGIPAIGQGFAKDGVKQTTEAALDNIAQEFENN
jgi:carbon monoxide dehydrogenase subunit G